MLKKIKENKKEEMIRKINTFIAFCFYKGYKDETILEKMPIINKYIDDNSDIDIYLSKKVNTCVITVYFINKKTQEEIINFKLPNIF